MKRLTLTRTSKQGECTTGILHEGEKVLCYTLEPMWRDLVHEKKVMGRTAIPEGKYRIRMSPSKKFHRMMPYLMEVPNFTGVMIHPGNRVEDTEGCILVGERDKPNTLVHSWKTFEWLYETLFEQANEEGGELEIVIE